MAEVKAVSRIEAILNGDNVTPVSRVEAILSGEDITPVTREEYFVKEFSDGHGGGSLDYVVPKQTATVVYDDTLQKYVAVFENVNVSGLNNDQPLFAKLALSGIEESTLAATFVDNTIVITEADMTIKKESGDFGRWYIEGTVEMVGVSVTLAVIKGF